MWIGLYAWSESVAGSEMDMGWVHPRYSCFTEERWASIGLEFGVQWVGVYTAAWQSVSHNQKRDVYLINGHVKIWVLQCCVCISHRCVMGGLDGCVGWRKMEPRQSLSWVHVGVLRGVEKVPRWHGAEIISRRECVRDGVAPTCHDQPNSTVAFGTFHTPRLHCSLRRDDSYTIRWQYSNRTPAAQCCFC